MELALVIAPIIAASIAVIAFPSRRREFWVGCFVVIALVQLAVVSAYSKAAVVYAAVLNVGMPWLIVVALLYSIPYPRGRFVFATLMPLVWAAASLGFGLYGLMIGVFHE
jgi:hypothetical protein